jgi:hypothetical protein
MTCVGGKNANNVQRRAKVSQNKEVIIEEAAIL